ncbi:MAG: type II toxin-antitoxin system HicA family toxin [Chromatiales bacterium]|jgi:hypothetical protein
MSKNHAKVLDAIFADHPSANLHWNEVASLLAHLGGELRESRGARVIVTLAGQELTLHHPHHGSALGRTELHRLKAFLTAAGVRTAD